MDGVGVSTTYDARAEIEGGGHPLGVVMASLKQLGSGEGFALLTPFAPAPLVGKGREQGFSAWTEKRGPGEFVTTFTTG
jgi:hypothetical protein